VKHIVFNSCGIGSWATGMRVAAQHGTENLIDWIEAHRAIKNKKYWEPYNVEFPMIDDPYMDKEQMCQWAESLGVKRPRLYDLGFSHNNCGGFCVKAGLGQFANLLRTMSERYAYHEQQQEG
jgi:hypothetical protein